MIIREFVYIKSELVASYWKLTKELLVRNCAIIRDTLNGYRMTYNDNFNDVKENLIATHYDAEVSPHFERKKTFFTSGEGTSTTQIAVMMRRLKAADPMMVNVPRLSLSASSSRDCNVSITANRISGAELVVGVRFNVGIEWFRCGCEALERFNI